MGFLLPFNEGDLIMQEGDKFGSLFIIIEGEVKIEKIDKDTGEIRILHVRKAGATLGEMSLIDMHNRSATVRAKTFVKVLSITSEVMSNFFDKEPAILTAMAINIAKTLSERLREADEVISHR